MANLGTIKSATLANGDVVTFQTKLYTGTGTAGTAGSGSTAYVPALWTFDIGYTPADGDMIAVKIPVAGVNSGIWMSVDGGTTYYPVAMWNKARLHTQYDNGTMLMLVYQTSAVTTVYGTSTAGAAAGASPADLTSNRWCVLNGYEGESSGGGPNPVIQCDTAVGIPSEGSSVSKNLDGITADHVLLQWNFSTSAENCPPVGLTLTTYDGYFTLTNNGGVTTETIQPVFALPDMKTVSSHT